MKRHIIIGAIVVAIAPLLVSAQSVTELQNQIQTLLAQVAALEQQLGAAVSTSSIATSTAAGAPAAPPAAVVCPVFKSTFGPGARGEAVSALQKFLADQKLLSVDSVTGFYGTLTEAAVQQFQAEQDVVSSGDAPSTGYGLVGPKTSAAIVHVCSTRYVQNPVQVSPTPSTTPPQAGSSTCSTIAIQCPTGSHEQVNAQCGHSCVPDIISHLNQ